MTALEKAINAAHREQYPDAKPGSEYEEALAWQISHCSNVPCPERQVQLLETRKFTVDFVWRKQRIAVEIDGGLWMQNQVGRGGGAHSRPANIIRDMEKSNLVQRAGYRFFRFTTTQVMNGEALEFIQELF